jgi:hypothetical protein
MSWCQTNFKPQQEKSTHGQKSATPHSTSELVGKLWKEQKQLTSHTTDHLQKRASHLFAQQVIGLYLVIFIGHFLANFRLGLVLLSLLLGWLCFGLA